MEQNYILEMSLTEMTDNISLLFRDTGALHLNLVWDQIPKQWTTSDLV